MSEHRKWQELSEEERSKAKEDYMRYESEMAICRKFNISRNTIRYHVKKTWEAERESYRAEVLSAFKPRQRQDFIKISQDAITIMKKAISHLAEKPVPPTMREAQQAKEILESLDKITRLDEGQPTDITAEKVVSVDQIIEVKQLNPFNVRKEHEKQTIKLVEEPSSDNNSDITDSIESDNSRGSETDSPE